MGFEMCGCVCMDFVMCESVYVWVLLFVGMCMYWFCNVGCVYVWVM